MNAQAKSKAHKVSQVMRIAERINRLNRSNPVEARKAARWFCLWLRAMNGVKEIP